MCSEPASAAGPPSPWVVKWAGLIPRGGLVLDVASGAGRHARFLAGLGFEVEAVDRDGAALADLAHAAGVATRILDLEREAWPYQAGRFQGIVVTNYLHRPLLPRLLESLAPGGILIYETFSRGNEAFGKPSNPDFLLFPGELLETVRGKLRVVAYEDVFVSEPRPAMIQRICAARPGNSLSVPV